MKKEYKTPHIVVLQIDATDMICDSITIDPGGGSGMGGANDRFDEIDFEDNQFLF